MDNTKEHNMPVTAIYETWEGALEDHSQDFPGPLAVYVFTIFGAPETGIKPAEYTIPYGMAAMAACEKEDGSGLEMSFIDINPPEAAEALKNAIVEADLFDQWVYVAMTELPMANMVPA